MSKTEKEKWKRGKRHEIRVGVRDLINQDIASKTTTIFFE